MGVCSHSQGSKRGVLASLREAGRVQAPSVSPERVRLRPVPPQHLAPFSSQGQPGACWHAWRVGAAWRPGARGPGTCSAQAPGSCASPTARAASRQPSGPHARASAVRVAPPRGAARDCAPARRSRTSVRPRVSPAFHPTPSPALPSLAALTAPRFLLQDGYPPQGTGGPRALPWCGRHTPLQETRECC